MTETIGMVGLGLVGTALSERLISAGYQVAGYDVVDAQVERLRASGGAACGSAREVASRSRTLLLSLPTMKESAEVVGAMGDALVQGSLLVDMTTGAPEESERMAAQLAACGVEYLEALIGGSSAQVRAGDSIAMCGGAAAAFARCEPLLRLCFREVFFLGACGNGSRMKLVTNLVLGLNRAVLAEGLALAERCGIEGADALTILKAGPAYSRAMDAKGRKMLERSFEPEARLSQHLKDVRLILKMGGACGARMPLSELHRSLLEEVESMGLGASDNSAILRAFIDGDK